MSGEHFHSQFKTHFFTDSSRIRDLRLRSTATSKWVFLAAESFRDEPVVISGVSDFLEELPPVIDVHVGGLPNPDYLAVAKAYGFPVHNIARTADLAAGISKVLLADGLQFCNVEIPAHHRVNPQVKFGRPNEDTEPLLPRDEFLSNMIIKALDVSFGPVVVPAPPPSAVPAVA